MDFRWDFKVFRPYFRDSTLDLKDFRNFKADLRYLRTHFKDYRILESRAIL